MTQVAPVLPSGGLSLLPVVVYREDIERKYEFIKSNIWSDIYEMYENSAFYMKGL